MGSFSIWHWLIVMAIVLLLFGGAGKIPKLMGDMAKGVKAFKQGLKDDEAPTNPTTPPQATLGQDAQSAENRETQAKH